MAEVGSSDGTTAGSPSGKRLGSYRLLEPLGTGGMSSVFRAEHIDTGNEVAVKVLPRTLAKNSTMLQRFLREAKNVEALDHPNIVAIYDRGEDQGRYYLVLEYLHGGDLHERVRKGVLAINDVVEIAVAVAHALRYAAANNVIHRDIKPANLLMTSDGYVKVTDFGLALQVEDDDERVTRDGTTVGTVDYMAPEQARDSRAASVRSDMYSLGCTLFFLLVGHAPYTGGDIADKLAKHSSEPIPDPRKERSEIPDELVEILVKLMAKKPDRRYKDYDGLLAALHPLRDLDSVEKYGDVLIDDGPIEVGGTSSATTATQSRDPNASTVARKQREISLAELAALHEDEPPVRAHPAPPPVTEARPAPLQRTRHAPPALTKPTTKPTTQPTPVTSKGQQATGVKAAPNPSVDAPENLTVLIDEDDEAGEFTELEELVEEHEPAFRASSQRTEFSLPVLLGLGMSAIMFVGLVIFGIVQLGGESTPVVVGEEIPPEEVVERPLEKPTEKATIAELPAAPTVPKPEVKSEPEPNPVTVVASAEPKPAPDVVQPAPKLPIPVASTVWVEPVDLAIVPIDERPFPGDSEARLTPDWAKLGSNERVDPGLISVDRIEKPADKTRFTSLKLAMEASAGTIEINDSGPYSLSEVTISGKGRHIRSVKGHRPIIKFEQADGKKPTSFVSIEGKRLILEGLDLVVDTGDARSDLTSLFKLQSSELTLRNCTVSFLNKPTKTFALVSIGDETLAASAIRSRVIIDRSFIRGPKLTAISWGPEPTDVVVARSVILGGTAPLFSLRGGGSGLGRRVSLNRSLLAGQGTLVDLGGALQIRSLGTTFARVEPTTERDCVVGVTTSDDPATMLDWSGESNTFIGWPALVRASVGVPRAVNLLALQNTWHGNDAFSVERPVPLPQAVLSHMPEQIIEYVPEQQPTLARVPCPSTWLREKTQTAFSRLVVPQIAPTPSNLRAQENQANPQDPVFFETTFNAQDPPWSGDLGAYVKQILKANPRIKYLRIHAEGTGRKTCTPLQLPVGVSLELSVDSPTGSGKEPLSWAPPTGVIAPALIEVRGGDLILNGIRLNRDETSRPMNLVKVDGGHLVLNHCRLTAPGKVKADGGGLVDFVATGTKPLEAKLSPFATRNDRPTCLITNSSFETGGIAVKANVGRGVIKAINSIFAVGQTAFWLNPDKVHHERFEADLQFERCSLSSEDVFISVGSWQGIESGPSRPWLISSQSSVFIDSYRRNERTSTLLKADPSALATNTVVWQSDGDVFELTKFIRGELGKQAALAGKPDFKQQWVDFWGPSKVVGAVGPVAGKNVPVLKLAVGRINPGEVQAGDLALDTSYDPSRKARSVGVEWRSLDVAPSTAPKVPSKTRRP